MHRVFALILGIETHQVSFVVLASRLIVLCAVDPRVLCINTLELIINVVFAVFKAGVQSVLPILTINRHFMCQNLFSVHLAFIVLLLVNIKSVLMNFTHVDWVFCSLRSLDTRLNNWCTLDFIQGRLFKVLLDVIGFRILEELVKAVTIKLDDLSLDVLAGEEREKCPIATAKTM